MKKTHLYKGLAALMISLLFLFFLYRLQKISLEELWSLFCKASPDLLLWAFLAILLANLVRSLRFHLLLRKTGSFGSLFASNNIYNLVTATLPGGLGEVFSVFVFKRYNDLDLGTAFSLLVLSRLFDLLSLCLMVLLALGYCPCSLGKVLTLVALVLGALALLLLLPPINHALVGLVNRFLPSALFFRRLKDFLSQVERALSYARDPKEWLFLLGLSFLVMSLNIFSLYVLLRAIDIDLSMVSSSVVFGIYAVLQLLPVHGLGGVGTQEAWWTLGLTSVGVSKRFAVPASFFLHGMFYFYILTIALVFGFPWLRRFRTRETATHEIFLSR